MYPLINKRETGINLRRIMDRQGVSAKDVQQYLGLGCVQSVYRWLDGVNVPSIDNLYALSELLGVPIDRLVCGNKKWKQLDNFLEVCGAREKRVYAYYHKLNNRQVA